MVFFINFSLDWMVALNFCDILVECDKTPREGCYLNRMASTNLISTEFGCTERYWSIDPRPFACHTLSYLGLTDPNHLVNLRK